MFAEDPEKRTAQNIFYAGRTITLLGQHPGDFFITEKGNFRRQGIAEIIGRLHFAGKLTDEQAIELAESAMEVYKSGTKVKEVEKMITEFAKRYL